jgi:Flp pilus assembly protein TadG
MGAVMNKIIRKNKMASYGEKDRAQGMVEFALVLPILLLLMFGIIEFGRLLFMYVSVSSASREAARYGAAVGDIGSGTLRYQDCDGIVAAASRVGVLAGISAADVVIQYDDGTNIKANSCEEVQDVYGSPIYLGDRIIVTVTRYFQPVVPLVNIPAVPISATTARTIVRDVGVMGTPLPTPTKIPTLTPTDTIEPTVTETPKHTKQNPTDTPTATIVPTTIPPTPTWTPGGPTATHTATLAPTPIPVCDPASYSIIQALGPDESGEIFSVYMTISNTMETQSDLTLTGVIFDWPYSPHSQELRIELKQIAYGNTGLGKFCEATNTCIWKGDPSHYSTISVCESGCDESFISGSDRELGFGEDKTLKFIFYKPLLSSFNDLYNPNPYPYNVFLVLDNSCYIETLMTHYLHP